MVEKVLVLSGSPEKRGNPGLLSARFMPSAKESCHQADKVFLRDKKMLRRRSEYGRCQVARRYMQACGTGK